MSRGLGKVQRGIMAALHRYKTLDIPDLTALVYFGSFDFWEERQVKARHLAAVRRALIKLRQRGLVRGRRLRPRRHQLTVDRFAHRIPRPRTIWRLSHWRWRVTLSE
jgi:hypothetical protein